MNVIYVAQCTVFSQKSKRKYFILLPFLKNSPFDRKNPTSNDNFAEIHIFRSFEKIIINTLLEHRMNFRKNMQLRHDVIDSSDRLEILHIGHSDNLFDTFSFDNKFRLTLSYDLKGITFPNIFKIIQFYFFFFFIIRKHLIVYHMRL